MVLSKGVLLRRYHIGMDLGKRRDHTALTVLEQQVVNLGRVDPRTYEPELERRFGVVLVEQVPLGTRYLEVSRYVRALRESQVFGGHTVNLSVDATGLGDVVLEQIREAVEKTTYVRGVVFTGGDKAHVENRLNYVPKVELVTGLMRMLESGAMGVAPGLPGWERLAGELLTIRRVMGERGAHYVSEGLHDDLAMSLALAAWGAWQDRLPVRRWDVQQMVGPG
jgi:hypothetical protein